MIKGFGTFFKELNDIMPITSEKDSEESLDRGNPYFKKPLEDMLVDYTNPVTKVSIGAAGSAPKDEHAILGSVGSEPECEKPSVLEQKAKDPLGVFSNWEYKL